MYGALFYPYDRPPLASESLRYAPIPEFVGLDFSAPEFRVGPREVFAAATMPETTVYENCYLASGPGEVGLPGNWPMLSVASKAGGPEKLCERQLSGCVAA